MIVILCILCPSNVCREIDAFSRICLSVIDVERCTSLFSLGLCVCLVTYSMCIDCMFIEGDMAGVSYFIPFPDINVI
jgi:hypothetical protein